MATPDCKLLPYGRWTAWVLVGSWYLLMAQVEIGDDGWDSALNNKVNIWSGLWISPISTVRCLVAQSCPTLCDPTDYNPRGFSDHGISEARILEWVALSFSRRSLQPRDWTQVSWISCIGRWILYSWTTREVHMCRGSSYPPWVVSHRKLGTHCKHWATHPSRSK